jgi:hypothetical protein
MPDAVNLKVPGKFSGHNRAIHLLFNGDLYSVWIPREENI